MVIIRLMLFITVAFSSSLLATTIYTWVDDTGVVHYSQQPPTIKDANKIYSEDIEPPKIGTYIPQKKTSVTVETELERSAKIINEADKQQAKEICESAKHNLSVLKTHSKLNQQDKASGRTVPMTEEQRQAAIIENTERVRLFCQSK
ncbi:DUF4124 domain-containing protein [Shewanella sp. A14]